MGIRSLARNTLKVKGHVGAPRWGQGGVISMSIIHTDLHKLNNELVTA
jgi:hypothetical protein